MLRICLGGLLVAFGFLALGSSAQAYTCAGQTAGCGGFTCPNKIICAPQNSGSESGLQLLMEGDPPRTRSSGSGSRSFLPELFNEESPSNLAYHEFDGSPALDQRGRNVRR